MPESAAPQVYFLVPCIPDGASIDFKWLDIDTTRADALVSGKLRDLKTRRVEAIYIHYPKWDGHSIPRNPPVLTTNYCKKAGIKVIPFADYKSLEKKLLDELGGTARFMNAAVMAVPRKGVRARRILEKRLRAGMYVETCEFG